MGIWHDATTRVSNIFGNIEKNMSGMIGEGGTEALMNLVGIVKGFFTGLFTGEEKQEAIKNEFPTREASKTPRKDPLTTLTPPPATPKVEQETAKGKLRG